MNAGADARVSQFRKGVLELAILALLDAGELYGVEIVDRLANVRGMAASSGTVYPLLSRLQKSGLVLSAWRESPSGPPRKYYRLSQAGRSDLATMSQSWHAMVGALDDLLEGAVTNA